MLKLISIITLTFMLVIVSQIQAIQVTDSDIALIFMFDEEAKQEVKDISENEHIGEIIGNVKWVEDGKFGGAFSFEGDPSWISVADHPTIQFPQGQDFTIAVYIKTEMSSGDPPMIVAKNYQPSEMRPWYALYYANQAKSLDGHVSIFLRDTAGNSHQIASNNTIADGEWHHVAGTRQGDTLRLYVDGVVEAEKDDADFDVGTNTAPLHINGHLDRWLIGLFDEIVIVRRALNESEIQALMNQGIEDVFLSINPKDKLSTIWSEIKDK